MPSTESLPSCMGQFWPQHRKYRTVCPIIVIVIHNVFPCIEPCCYLVAEARDVGQVFLNPFSFFPPFASGGRKCTTPVFRLGETAALGIRLGFWGSLKTSALSLSQKLYHRSEFILSLPTAMVSLQDQWPLGHLSQTIGIHPKSCFKSYIWI